MSLSPLAVTMGLPLAVGAIENGLKLAGNSFQSLIMAAQDSLPATNDINPEIATPTSATERLGNLAAGVRDWLRQHGIRFPYSISVSDHATEVPQIAIEGSERERIAELLDQNPSLRDQIRNLVKSQALMTPLGFQGKTAVVTESASYFE